MAVEYALKQSNASRLFVLATVLVFEEFAKEEEGGAGVVVPSLVYTKPV